VIYLYSRRLVVYAVAGHCKASLACDALKAAIAARDGKVQGVIVRIDRGSRHSGSAF